MLASLGSVVFAVKDLVTGKSSTHDKLESSTSSPTGKGQTSAIFSTSNTTINTTQAVTTTSTYIPTTTLSTKELKNKKVTGDNMFFLMLTYKFIVELG